MFLVLSSVLFIEKTEKTTELLSDLFKIMQNFFERRNSAYLSGIFLIFLHISAKKTLTASIFQDNPTSFLIKNRQPFQLLEVSDSEENASKDLNLGLFYEIIKENSSKKQQMEDEKPLLFSFNVEFKNPEIFTTEDLMRSIQFFKDFEAEDNFSGFIEKFEKDSLYSVGTFWISPFSLFHFLLKERKTVEKDQKSYFFIFFHQFFLKK